MPKFTQVMILIVVVALAIAIILSAKKLRQIKWDSMSKKLELNFDKQNKKSITNDNSEKRNYE